LNGYHMREADLLFEIIDPVSGEVLPDGCEGEVVFTTLTRQGMPLIRYRTGDISKFMTEPCPCGSVLKRMAPVRDRLLGRVALAGGDFLSMAILDEAVFEIPGVLNFEATLSTTSLAFGSRADCLSVKVQAAEWAGEEIAEAVEHALLSIPLIAKSIHQRHLTVSPVAVDRSCELWKPVKRVIKDVRIKERA
jgi:phenylacetate-CoA ligase